MWVWRAEIGMFCLDRSRASCVHASSFCREHCMWNKLERCFPGVRKAQLIREKLWFLASENWDYVCDLADMLKRKRKQIDRIRICSCGEAFTCDHDIWFISDLARLLPESEFWITTRAWKSKKADSISRDKLPSNVILMASVDPSDAPKTVRRLAKEGWQLIFFGDDDHAFDGIEWVKCPKTWGKKKGHCATCKTGCFAGKHVWLKEH